MKLSGKPRQQLNEQLANGNAYDKFLQIVEQQGGSPEDIERFSALHEATVKKDLMSRASGEILAIDAAAAGRVSLQLGAGRQRVHEGIDFSVGLSNIRKVGERINAGEALLTVHAKDNPSAEAACENLHSAIRIE
jgi:pyrimidine-nucleoside phosphorylase